MDFLPAIALAGLIGGLIGCEVENRTKFEPVPQTEKNSLIELSTPAEERFPGEQSSQVEEIIPAVELGSPPVSVADNSLCDACHVNFKKETLTLTHAHANIGCTQCHGASDAHRADEDIITPPDIMFPKAEIKSFCSGCHTQGSINDPAHKTVMAEADPLKAYCTDCHGEHRLNYRTRKWDKITRDLIKDARVRRLSDEIFE